MPPRLPVPVGLVAMKKLIAGGAGCCACANNAAQPKNVMATAERTVVLFIVVPPLSLPRCHRPRGRRLQRAQASRDVPSAALEIRFVGDRHVVVEDDLVVLG